MANPIATITCVVGIIGCIIGVATFVSAQLTKARENGALFEKVDYLVKSFDEQKRELKERHTWTTRILDEHTRDITNLKTRVEHLEEEIRENGK